MFQRLPRVLECLFLCVLTGASVAIPSPAKAEEFPASTQPYGRACLVVEETSTEAGSPLVNTILFDDQATPGPGRRLVLYVDATIDSYVVAAAFNDKDRRLANGWQPQLVELKAREEQRLPLSPTTWEWEDQPDGFSVYVVFLKRTAGGVDTLQNLVAALQEPAANPALLDLQAKKLREEIVASMTGQESAAFHAGTTTSAWGGTLRGEPFPWPRMARKVEFQPNGRGTLVYHGRE